MRASLLVSLASGALAARPFLNEPDTGIVSVLGDTPESSLPALDDLVGLHDFEWVARRYLPLANYTYYHNGAAGEWSARNNLEVFYRYMWRARQMIDITRLPDTLECVPAVCDPRVGIAPFMPDTWRSNPESVP